MRIVFGADHAAAALKREIMDHVAAQGHEVTDLEGESNDYPVTARAAAQAVSEGRFDRGMLFCGTGQGMMLAANKVRGVRCAVCSDPYSALMARRHNDANMLALGARVLGAELAKMLADLFLSTDFEGGRHQRRVSLIGAIENERAEEGT
ncbi:MAG: ribose 5-phosphate isomerase B [Oscillospiraceae bacterium]|jgi:ribose 5-phosphate isomerase B|nr:ribose 5-phosphate isomerase B [Oscillospiraceae bacterium]